MHEGTLSIARDASLVILALEAMVLAIVPCVLLYYVTRWLAGFLPQVRPFIRSIAEQTQRIQSAVTRIMLSIRRPFVLLRSLGTGLRTVISLILKGRWEAWRTNRTRETSS
jgi:hypothetical protein